MRLAAQAKQGYYPAHPDAIAGILKHLRIAPGKTPGDCCVLDPCAGEGLAIRQLAQGLGIPESKVYACELDAGRAARVREHMPESQVLGPATFLGIACSNGSFGIVYCNPPFDHELGGGRREEETFARNAIRLLVPGSGILILVCPVSALAGNRQFVEMMDSRLEDIHVWKFPDHCRPYREIIVIGRRRKVELSKTKAQQTGHLGRDLEFGWRTYHDRTMNALPVIGGPQPVSWGHYGIPSADLGPGLETYDIPASWKPSTWKKCQYTDEELAQELASSPLNRLLSEVTVSQPRRPPLPLAKGHVALLLASGILDGVVEAPDGSAHVVRGTASKVEYLSKIESTENAETGAVSEKQIFSQKVILTIRAVDEQGTIHTFSDQPPANVGEGDESQTEEEAA